MIIFTRKCGGNYNRSHYLHVAIVSIQLPSCFGSITKSLSVIISEKAIKTCYKMNTTTTMQRESALRNKVKRFCIIKKCFFLANSETVRVTGKFEISMLYSTY